MNDILLINSKDNTDLLIYIDKIQYVLQTTYGCKIGLDNGTCLQSGAKFNDVMKALKKLNKT